MNLKKIKNDETPPLAPSELLQLWNDLIFNNSDSRGRRRSETYQAGNFRTLTLMPLLGEIKNMAEGSEKQALLADFDRPTDYRRPNNSLTTIRLTIDHTAQHLAAILPPQPQIAFFANKEPFSMVEDRIAVPRTKYGAQGSSGSAWRIPSPP